MNEVSLTSKLNKLHDPEGHGNCEGLNRLKTVTSMEVSDNDLFVCEVCELNTVQGRYVTKKCSSRAKQS